MSERSTSGAPRARLVPGRGIGRSGAELSPDTPLTVGRLAECGLCLDDASLSRRHATVWFAEGSWWVRDESSLNGTYLNGERIETAALTPGDHVDFGGQAEFTFQAVAADAAVSAESRFAPARLFCCGLQPLEGGRVRVLRRRLTLVGRNATADLVLDDPGVSGVHARILRAGSRLSVMDSGSRNGTVVNGETVRRAEVGPGDEIHFGGRGFRVVRTAVPTGRALTAGASLALVLIAAVVLPLLLRVGSSQAQTLWTRQMYLSQVTESLVSAVRACDRQPRADEVARAQFAIARRSLIAADILRPDRQTDDDLRAALRQAAVAEPLARELAGRDLFQVYRSLDEPVAAAAAPAPPPPEAFDLEEELSRMVAQFGIDTRVRPIPPRMIDEVARCIEFWTGPKRGFTERSMVRSRAHLEMIRQELRRSRLPELFCYLPFIESGYITEAESGAAAKGMWQFMASTGRDYGLRIDGSVDERTDPLKSTQAACRYLESLLNMFGPNAFLCAVAAYNKGENGMARCLKRSGNWRSTWKFWDVVANNDGCLKPETVEYVPRFLAAAVILRRPEAFGLTGS